MNNKAIGSLIGTILLIGIGITGYNLLGLPEEKSVPSSMQPGFGENTNSIGFGLQEISGELIPNGSTLQMKEQKVTKTVSLVHHIDTERNYALLLFENFKQIPFDVDGQSHTVYEFTMQPNTSSNIEVTAELSAEAQELDYVIIKKPEYLLKEKDINRAHILQEVLPLRFLVSNDSVRSAQAMNYAPPEQLLQGGPNDNVFISQTPEKLLVLYTHPYRDPAYLSLGNIDTTELDYAVVALMGWQQIPLQNSGEPLFVKLKPSERAVFPLRFPSTDHEQNFQVLAFPKPFQVSRSDYTSQAIYGSMRTVVEP